MTCFRLITKSIMNKKDHHNYRDLYFEKGHWGIKIWQTIIVLCTWIILFIPIIVTISTYLAYKTHGQRGYFFWYYTEGFHELNFLLIFLTFVLGISAIFCFSMAYIQIKRSHGLVEKWPLFDIDKDQWERRNAERFMEKRFGSEIKRQSYRSYTVLAKQNLSKNQLKKIVNGEEPEEE